MMSADIRGLEALRASIENRGFCVDYYDKSANCGCFIWHIEAVGLGANDAFRAIGLVLRQMPGANPNALDKFSHEELVRIGVVDRRSAIAVVDAAISAETGVPG